MNSPFSIFRISILRQISGTSRLFSWKSRLKRDPELRERKLETLSKRFRLRKLEELDDVASSATTDSMMEGVKDLVDTRIKQISERVSKLSNVTDVERAAIEDTEVGKGLKMKQLVLSISQPNARTAIVVVKDKGNTERIHKVLKREFPNLRVSLMDRERVELRMPQVTDELREQRGEQIDMAISVSRKELKKLELQAYDDARKLKLPDRELLPLRTSLRDIFAAAEMALDTLFKSAMDELDLDVR